MRIYGFFETIPKKQVKCQFFEVSHNGNECFLVSLLPKLFRMINFIFLLLSGLGLIGLFILLKSNRKQQHFIKKEMESIRQLQKKKAV